jgi:tRNA(Arg) A34 adenosine deaminase TadA
MRLPGEGGKRMNSFRCCQGEPRADDDAHPQKARLRRARGMLGWMLPGALLALMPKCPMCLAAYVALGTGFTMSGSSAHLLRRALTALCLGVLALCVVRRVVSCCQNKRTLNLQITQTHP